MPASSRRCPPRRIPALLLLRPLGRRREGRPDLRPAPPVWPGPGRPRADAMDKNGAKSRQGETSSPEGLGCHWCLSLAPLGARPVRTTVDTHPAHNTHTSWPSIRERDGMAAVRFPFPEGALLFLHPVAAIPPRFAAQERQCLRSFERPRPRTCFPPLLPFKMHGAPGR